MNTPLYLQSVVSPVCRFTVVDEICMIQKMHGTAFLATTDGVFITARHVIENAFSDRATNGGEIGVFPTTNINGAKRTLTVLVIDYEHAPHPYDISIFRTKYCSGTPFRFQELSVNVWQDVATTGYPISVVRSSEKYEVQQRAHKGYVQRVIPPGRIYIGEHPNSFEVSFPITQGLSGSPLVIHRQDCDVVRSPHVFWDYLCLKSQMRYGPK